MIQNFHSLEMSLSTDLKMTLFLSNKVMVIFSITDNDAIFISQQTNKIILILKLIEFLEVAISSASTQIHFDWKMFSRIT